MEGLTGSTQPKQGLVIVVQGGQWGSEAKGLIAHKLTLERKVDVAIRTGTVNAGHTVYHDGRAYAMQQIPVSWVRPECELVLGPGAYIHPDILQRELMWISKATGVSVDKVLSRVWIDTRCGLHLSVHTDRSKASDRHHKMGATGKGCSEAVIDKISNRGSDNGTLFRHWVEFMALESGFWRMVKDRIKDTVFYVNWRYDQGDTLLVEGTQGTLLDLHLGDYPYTTHKQTQVTSWLAESGLAATVNKEVWGVYRTYPIKVAGNSGPMPGEVSWLQLAREINGKAKDPLVSERALKQWVSAMQMARDEHFPELTGALPADPALWSMKAKEENRAAASELHKLAFEMMSPSDRQEVEKLFELTTVTRKLRRIGKWDWPTFRHSITLNRPTHLALTFMNYKFPRQWGEENLDRAMVGEVGEWLRDVNRNARGARTGIVSFGPQLTHTHYIG